MAAPRKHERWLWVVGLVPVALLLFDIALTLFSPIRANDFKRWHRYADLGPPPENSPHAIRPAYLSDPPSEFKDTPWPQYVGGGIDFSKREAPGLWDPRTYYLKPEYRGRSIAKLSDGSPLYDIEIATDAYGRRIGSPISPGSKRKNAILVFGDSLAFGEGVPGAETLPGQLERAAPSFRAYNYGLPAGGPMQALARLQDIHGRAEVAETSGVAIYLYLPDHVRRANASIFYNSIWRYAPFFRQSPRRGNWVRYSNFPEARPFTDFVFQTLSRSSLLNGMNFNYPITSGESEHRQVAGIFREMDRTFRRKFKDGRFYVILSPENRGQGQVRRFLDEAAVKHVDYQDAELWRLMKETPYIHPAYDHTLNSNAFRWLALQLTRDLGLNP